MGSLTELKHNTGRKHDYDQHLRALYKMRLSIEGEQVMGIDRWQLALALMAYGIRKKRHLNKIIGYFMYQQQGGNHDGI
jgi:hypothetical protein